MGGNSGTPRILEGEDGYRLWQRYELIEDEPTRCRYAAAFTSIVYRADSDIVRAAVLELKMGISGLLGQSIESGNSEPEDGALCLLTAADGDLLSVLGLVESMGALGNEGYAVRCIQRGSRHLTVVAGNTDIAVLYGAFALLRALQTRTFLDRFDITSAPRIRRRLLNHWDNLDGTIERGYAGWSLWDWHKLPHYVSPRYVDYARSNASIGINGAVLNNVNSNALILTLAYLEKVATLATVFRPYGIRVYLSARFSAPIEIGGMATADPLAPEVIEWWKRKVRDIYELIPDFGGFLVKANSEGQPGPNDYHRTHADGANLLADALRPHGGVVIWRAFVYDVNISAERHCQANLEFMPQDGTFAENAFLQVKNGPIDFQPREPFHPLFGAMPKTKLCLEFQITQEYLGNATHLVYLAPLFKETLLADTVVKGSGSSVARIVEGTIDGHRDSAIAGVSNIGCESSWCGHPFGAANWYAFGRLAWDHQLSAASVAEEWLRMTFTNAQDFVEPAKQMMLDSREAVVNYMTPLGLHHIMAWDHHHGPGPWVAQGRADWTSPYYHQADAEGIGANRTITGSNAIAQYSPAIQSLFGDPEACPAELLLWFHHVPWNRRLRSGRTLWNELCTRYAMGVETVRAMRRTWENLASAIDPRRAEHVRALLKVQEREACWWRDACLLYFQTFSKQPLPEGFELPAQSLDDYRNLTLYYVPGIPERRFGR